MPARAASVPMEPHQSRGSTVDRRHPSSAAAFRARWPTLLLFGGVAVVTLAALRLGSGWLRSRPGASSDAGSQAALGWLVLVSLLWGVLLWNNIPSLSREDGFDASGHLRYIRYVAKHHRIPWAGEGWETYQPPLFYVLSALTLKATGLSISNPSALSALRMQSLAFGIAQLSLVFGCLRLLFPGSPRRQVLGLILAAFLPMHLYLYQYPTNEALGATLASASIYAALLVLRSPQPSFWLWGALGACLGAAMLAKVSALLVVVPVWAAVSGPLVFERGAAGQRLRGIAVMLLVGLAVCGSWLVGVWQRFGSPIVRHRPGLDPTAAAPWWQDPGYLTLEYFLRFGRSLTAPLFSGFHSFADGVYSTLWGDGLIGGRSALWTAPPWNYDLMAMGYVLALLPTLAVALGASIALVRFVRSPSAEWFVLSGVAAGAVLALILIVLQDGSYAQSKAFFAISALVPLCAFGAWGLDRLMSGGTLRHALVAVGIGVWAINAYATFWVPHGGSEALARLGRLHLASRGHESLAEPLLRDALMAEPDNATARMGIATLLEEQGRGAEAISELEQLLRVHPMDADVHERLAVLLTVSGKIDEAIPHHDRTLEIDPDFAEAHANLADLLWARGRPNQAIGHYREAIRVQPQLISAHIQLGRALASRGDLEEGIDHLRLASRLDPGSGRIQGLLAESLALAGRSSDAVAHFQAALVQRPDAPQLRAGLAWILATHPDATVRDPQQALRHARRAVALTRSRDAGSLDTLAAALAAAGQFERALATARNALALDPAADAAEGIRERIELYRRGRPYVAGTGP
jgi:tetratricopeptide (TPR) repeat protein